ncbi:MAG: polyisoprenoid-binding protein [Chloroflexi bacterium]|nr:MAG: polyisoprenoid-binding protein [Chloroflexota bacterium]
MSWQVDYTHSLIQFSVRHMMVTNARGQFDKWTAEVHLDEANPENSTVFVQIDANSINTKLADRDAHLCSPDFLDAASYPYITFRSKRVQRIDRTHARLIGDLTIRGISREVAVDVTYEGQVRSPFGPFVSAGFHGETKINRKEWNLNWNMAIETGGVVVGDEVKISIELEVTKPVEEPVAEAVTA